MKTISVFLFFATICFYSSVAQDIITLKSGDELKGKIIRFNPKDVVFVPTGVNDTITMWRNDVVQLHYQNGITIKLSDEKEIRKDSLTAYDSMYYKGVSDASEFYRGYQGAATGTLVTALVFPFNIIPAVVCSSTPPNDTNLGYRDNKLMENPGYNTGYKNQAHKIKRKKVWKNYGIGSGAMIAFYLVISAVAATAVVY